MSLIHFLLDNAFLLFERLKSLILNTSHSITYTQYKQTIFVTWRKNIQLSSKFHKYLEKSYSAKVIFACVEFDMMFI